MHTGVSTRPASRWSLHCRCDCTAPACVVCLLGRFLVRERILFPIRLFFTCVPVLAVIDQLIAPYGYACLCLPPLLNRSIYRSACSCF
jgi:hypothetical protein